MNWSEVRDILLVSYRLAALKRMLRLLDASGTTSSGRSRPGLAKVTKEK
jgi:hypothetical protein